jgi:hypothetical protein
MEDDKVITLLRQIILALGGDNMKFFSKGELISTGIKLRDFF